MSQRIVPFQTDPLLMLNAANASRIPAIGASINQFLQSDDTRRIVVGAKGAGKTTALGIKAVNLRHAGFEVRDDWLEFIKAVTLPATTPTTDWSHLHRPHSWILYWQLALALVFACWQNRSELQKGTLLSSIVSQDNKIIDQLAEGVLQQLTSKGASPVHIALQNIFLRRVTPDYAAQYFMALDQKALNQGDAQYTLLLDQIDEGFEEYRDPEAGGISIWEAAQIGLIDAIYEMNQRGDSFRVYASVRAEAFRQYAKWGRGVAKISGSVATLAYTDADLNRIFAENLEMVQRGDMSDSSLDTPEEKFFGRPTYENPFTHEEEPPLQWLKRHTFGQPRELMLLGQHILGSDPTQRSNRAYVSQIVNEQAQTIAQDHVAALFPTWKLPNANLGNAIKHNVLPAHLLETVEAALPDMEGVASKLGYLHACGLLGIPVETGDTDVGFVQRFIKPEQRYEYETLPDAPYYVVHPALYTQIRATLTANEKACFFSEQFTPGHGLPCPSNVANAKFVIGLDRTHQRASLSFFPEADLWMPNTEQVEHHLVDDLNLDSPNVGKVALFGLLRAMKEESKNHVSFEEIVTHIIEWSTEGFIQGQIGSKAESLEAYFVRNFVQGSDGNAHALRTLRDQLDPLGVKLHVSGGGSFQTGTLTIEDLNWSEVRYFNYGLGSTSSAR